MRTITKEELSRILNDHENWLKDYRKGGRACLRNADLNRMNLGFKRLENADLEGSCLHNASLFGTDLSDTNLKRANLSYADLGAADLKRADLRGANLKYASLRCADLKCADLRGADLKCADLRGADLKCADLERADLHYAKLDPIERPRLGMILQEPITGYKTCLYGVIVELTIPEGAIVYSINNYKCRTNKAIVTNIHGADRAYSLYKYFTYYIGDKINIKNFNLEYNIECAEGIHFFHTFEEAREHYISEWC